MTDIVPELLEKIKKEFDEKISKNKKIKSAMKAIEEGTCDYETAYNYASEVGEILADTLKKNITKDVLPDGKMYYNIANRILNDRLKNNHNIVADTTSKITSILNKKAKINIKPQEPKLNKSRISGLVEKLADGYDFDEVSWLLGEPVVNFSQNIVDESIKENAEFHHEAGLKAKIIRKSTGHCCDWCESIAGEYEYPDVPKDVYRRHRSCRCTVEYLPKKGKRQNVHTKEFFPGKTNAELEKFRERQVNYLIKNRIEKDKKEASKFQRKLKNSLLNEKINGVKIKDVSEHFAERAILRKLDVNDIVDTLKNPLKTTDIKYDAENRPSFKIIGEKSTISINPKNGNMITAHKTHSKLLKKLKGEEDENSIK